MSAMYEAALPHTTIYCAHNSIDGYEHHLVLNGKEIWCNFGYPKGKWPTWLQGRPYRRCSLRRFQATAHRNFDRPLITLYQTAFKRSSMDIQHKKVRSGRYLVNCAGLSYTLLHEVSHLIGGGITEERFASLRVEDQKFQRYENGPEIKAYGIWAITELAKIRPINAPKNASSIEYFLLRRSTMPPDLEQIADHCSDYPAKEGMGFQGSRMEGSQAENPKR